MCKFGYSAREYGDAEDDELVCRNVDGVVFDFGEFDGIGL